MAAVKLEDVKTYMRVDYDDDDALIQIMLDAVTDEMTELIPTFEPGEPTNRQKILIMSYCKELYDKRGNTTDTSSADNLRYAIQSLLLKERLR